DRGPVRGQVLDRGHRAPQERRRPGRARPPQARACVAASRLARVPPWPAMDAFVSPDVTEVDRRSRRFTQVFLIVLLGGLVTTAGVAVVVDPFRVFATGGIPTEVVNERVIKPELFLAASPPPQAII